MRATTAGRQQLKEAQNVQRCAGVAIETELAAVERQVVLPTLAKALAPSLLVVGAFGHSQSRQFLMGSTAIALLRMSNVQVLILR